MTLRRKIFLGILILLLLGIGAVAVWFRDDIGAVIAGMRYSTEELEQQLAENDQTIRDTSQLLPDLTIRELTEEDKQALKDGTVTAEDLIQSMVEPVQKPEQIPTPPVADAPSPSVGKEEQPPAQAQPQPESPAVQVSDYQKQLASIIAEVYVLREEFLMKLDDLLAQAKAEYVSLPSEERTSSKLSSLAGKYFSVAYNLELQCDNRMRDIIARMESLLEENDQDLSIAQSVFDTYLKEKSLKKSWYLAELKKRGI